MPARSKAQKRWAYWAEENPKKAGVTKKVAREFQHTIPNAPERVSKRKGRKK